MNSQPVKQLDRVRHKIRLKHYSIRTEKAYVSWIRRYIYFHNKRHPREMDAGKSKPFLPIWPLMAIFPLRHKTRHLTHYCFCTNSF